MATVMTPDQNRQEVPAARESARYMPGFGNHFSTEAVAGALPIGQNSPQKAPFGLYAELISGTAFTAPRHENRRTWMYRLRPTASHKAFAPYGREGLLRTAPFNEAPPPPNRLRWNPLPQPDAPTDFVDGLTTYAGNGDVGAGAGLGIHLYAANRSMEGRVFFSADGEMLIVPQQGRLRLETELGVIEAPPSRSRWCRVACASACTCRRAAPGAMCARTTARPFACPSWGRSAPTGWPTRATLKPPSPALKTGTSRPR